MGIVTLFKLYISIRQNERKKTGRHNSKKLKKAKKNLKKIVDNKKNLLYNASEKGKGVFET